MTDATSSGPDPSGIPEDDARSARAEAVIEALGCGSTHEATAALLGVSTKTIQRLLHDPSIRAAVAARRRQSMAEQTGTLIAASPVAIEALVDVARTGTSRDRVLAASRLLTIGRHHYSSDLLEADLEERISALEAERETPTDGEGGSS